MAAHACCIQVRTGDVDGDADQLDLLDRENAVRPGIRGHLLVLLHPIGIPLAELVQSVIRDASLPQIRGHTLGAGSFRGCHGPCLTQLLRTGTGSGGTMQYTIGCESDIWWATRF